MKIDGDKNVYLDGKIIGKEISPQFTILRATEDGSSGYKGTVIDLLKAVFEEEKRNEG